MRCMSFFGAMTLMIITGQLGAVMAPWYWVGFPVQLNYNYVGSPERLIGAHYTFIFDTYHYQKGKKYPAGRIMQSNDKILYWYVALIPQRKNVQMADNSLVVASIEPTPSVIHMLQLPKDTSSIAITIIGTPDSWSKLWMEDRQMMRKEFQEESDGTKKRRKRWLMS